MIVTDSDYNVQTHLYRERTASASTHLPTHPTQRCLDAGVKIGKCLSGFLVLIRKLQPPWSRCGESTGGDLPLLIIFRSDGCSSHIHFRTTKKQEILSEPPKPADAHCPLCWLNKGLVLTKLLKKHHLFWSSGPWNCTSEPCGSDLGVEGITCFVSHRPTRVFVSCRYERFLRSFFPPTIRTFPCCDKPDQAGDPVALPSLPVPSCDRLSWY